MQVPEIKCRKTNKSIFLFDLLSVFLKGSDKLVAWGWFEFNEEDGFYFRYDWHYLVGTGEADVINLKEFDFEISKYNK